MHLVKVRGASDRPKWENTELEGSAIEGEPEITSVSLPNWNLKLCILQVDGGKPIVLVDGLLNPWDNQPLASKGSQEPVEPPQIQYRPKSSILLGNEEVAGAEPSLLIGLPHLPDGVLRQESVDLCCQNLPVLRFHHP